jgi:hypothetical protein
MIEMSSPWPEDYYTPVAEMDTNHILKSTLTDESRQLKGDSRTCLFCGFSYFFRPIHARYHLVLGSVSKKLDVQTSPSGCRPISWEMHQLQKWNATSPSFVIVSTTSTRLSPEFPTRGIHSLDTRRLPRTSSQKRRSMAALPCSRVWRPGLCRRFQ